MKILHISALVAVLLASALFTTSSAEDNGISIDQPNPIATSYPDDVTGSLNGTTMIVPIEIELAQNLIPQYCILQSSYRSILPTFPKGMYPLMVTAKHDHDLQVAAYNLSMPDFTRAAFEFPFIDLSGDGATPYRLQRDILITASNQAAIDGSRGVGVNVYPAEFDPANDAYCGDGSGGTYFSATASAQDGSATRFLTISARPLTGYVTNPYPFEFIENITNQVTFANSTVCDEYRLLYNTSLTAAPYQPVSVIGTVSALLEPFTTSQTWTGVHGWQYAAAFIEPLVPSACPSPS